MSNIPTTETIACPCCGESRSTPWAEENGFTAVKCTGCGLVYVNPRPISALIDEAVQTGVHSNVDHGRTAINYRVNSKVRHYRKIFASMFEDVWQGAETLSWLDIGAGYGEVLDAIETLAPPSSKIEGLEPMEPKRAAARLRGLTVREGYLSGVKDQFDFVSLVNVFSHIPDFPAFLEVLRKVLRVGGEFFIETGDVGDLAVQEMPGELDLPDHLVFASEQNIRDCLTRAGFTIIGVEKRRTDDLLNFAKVVVKKIIGRKVTLALPYTSRYRTMMIRAKLTSTGD